MSDNMCEHGGLDGNCLRCKDATITRLEAEKAQKQLVIDDCKRNLQEQDAAIAALRGEAALYQKEWAILREEVERLNKELRILYASNADMFARAEQAEKELAAERGKVEEFLSCEHTISNGGLMDNYTDVARARRRQAEIINEWKRSAK